MLAFIGLPVVCLAQDLQRARFIGSNELESFRQGIAQVGNGISTKNCYHWLWELVGRFCEEFNESHFGLEMLKQSLNCEVIEKSRHPYHPWIILLILFV